MNPIASILLTAFKETRKGGHFVCNRFLTTFKESRKVGYSLTQMHSLVANVSDYPAFVPSVLSSKINSTTNNTQSVDLVIGFQGFHESYTSTVTISPNSVRAVASNSKLFKILVNQWQFTPLDAGCILTLDLQFEFHSMLYSQLSLVFLNQVSSQLISSFEKRALVLYGRPLFPSKSL